MIKELVIISGKGGTGKTSVAASFAFLAKNRVAADCDVDAADLNLVIGGTTIDSGDFEGGKKAFINADICNRCGECLAYCRFDAISDAFAVDALACEGCGVCVRFCPRGAITMKNHISGRWFLASSPHGPLVHAKLGIAEGNSGKLVTLIKRIARDIAMSKRHTMVIIDGSPGTGCPVIASISGAAFVLIVTEPTVAGFHDLRRVHELTRHFRVQAGVCINKHDINDEICSQISEFCRDNDVKLFPGIPYDIAVTQAQIAGKSVVEYSNGDAAVAICRMWDEIQCQLD
jgi:MinD superfamily P-loop ATPase